MRLRYRWLPVRRERYGNIGSIEPGNYSELEVDRRQTFLIKGHLDPGVEKAPSPIAALESGT
jgi:hypothetical protein